jgi:hypothetical protein
MGSSNPLRKNCCHGEGQTVLVRFLALATTDRRRADPARRENRAWRRLERRASPERAGPGGVVSPARVERCEQGSERARDSMARPDLQRLRERLHHKSANTLQFPASKEGNGSGGESGNGNWIKGKARVKFLRGRLQSSVSAATAPVGIHSPNAARPQFTSPNPADHLPDLGEAPDCVFAVIGHGRLRRRIGR